MATQCLFCNYLDPTVDRWNQAWYLFHVIAETDNFIAVPALGCIVPGYMLVLTKQHIFSMAQLKPHELVELESFVDLLSKKLTEKWAPPVIFEHGACNETETAGSCIEHAHWHLVPGNWDLLPIEINFEKVSAFEEFAGQKRGMAYLFFRDPFGNSYITNTSHAPSQLFRRKLADQLGKADEWDYAVFPFIDNIRETVDKLEGIR